MVKIFKIGAFFINNCLVIAYMVFIMKIELRNFVDAVESLVNGGKEMGTKKARSLALVGLAAFALSGCNQNAVEEYSSTPEIVGSNATYDLLGTGSIPIGMWVTPPDAYRNEEAFARMAEVGITMVNGFSYYENTDEEVNAVLDYCEKFKMKYLFASLQLESDITSYVASPNQSFVDDAMTLIAKFASHPAFAGTIFIDEPSGSYFDALAVFFEAYRTQFPGKIAYVNNLPIYGLGGTGYSRYTDYADAWIKKSKTSLYSYDFYPLYADDGSSEGYEYEDSRFYYNLDLLRSKTLAAGIPLWSFAATLGYTHPTEKARRTPSREDLRWSVFSDLAFGSKCIQYFTYFTPSQDTYGEGLVTRAGEKTVRYDYAKELNAEVKNYGSLLLNSDAVGVLMSDYRRNGQTLYAAPKTSFGPIRSIEGEHYLIGCFQDKDKGDKYALLTATNPREELSLTLHLYQNIKSLQAIDGDGEKTLTVESGDLTLKLAKGDALFIKL